LLRDDGCNRQNDLPRQLLVTSLDFTGYRDANQFFRCVDCDFEIQTQIERHFLANHSQSEKLPVTGPGGDALNVVHIRDDIR
jgi:hypothetical protein